MSSVILESRQVNGSIKQIGINGQYTSNLRKSVTIENGDTVQLRNVFIDSVDEATTIQVDSATDLTMEYILFTTLNDDLKVEITNDAPDSADAAAQVGDNILYCNDVLLATDMPEAEKQKLWYRSTNFITTQQGDPRKGFGDGFQYCATTKTAIDATHSRVTSITLFKNLQLTNVKWGNFTLTWYYKNSANKVATYKQHIPPLTTTTSYTFTFPTLTGPVFVNADGFHLGKEGVAPAWNTLNPNFKMGEAVDVSEGGNLAPPYSSNGAALPPQLQKNAPKLTTEAGQTGDSYVPVFRTKTITIDPGSYAPSVLANIISRKFNAIVGNTLNTGAYLPGDSSTIPPDPARAIYSSNPADAVTVPTNSSNGELYQSLGSTQDGVVGGDSKMYITSIDDSNIFVTVWSDPTFPAPIGGCANFEIDFDNDTQTFKIPRLHTEYYYNAAPSGQPPQYVEGMTVSQVGVHLRQPPGETIVPTYANARYTSYNYDRGCLLITDLTSSRADGKPSNFWFNELGFSTTIQASVSTTFKGPSVYFSAGTNSADTNNRHVPHFDFAGLEMGVKRTAPYVTPSFLCPEQRRTLNYNVAQQTGNTNFVQPIQATDTTQVFGVRTLQSILARDAYFKIIINGVPANRLHDQESVQFISAIISKYYSGQSYTNGFSSDSITYVHSGAPIQLSAFDINIYKSDNTPADIGPDNSLFIEITKGDPAQDPETAEAPVAPKSN